jgi:hypothetical protein
MGDPAGTPIRVTAMQSVFEKMTVRGHPSVLVVAPHSMSTTPFTASGERVTGVSELNRIRRFARPGPAPPLRYRREGRPRRRRCASGP